MTIVLPDINIIEDMYKSLKEVEWCEYCYVSVKDVNGKKSLINKKNQCPLCKNIRSQGHQETCKMNVLKKIEVTNGD